MLPLSPPLLWLLSVHYETLPPHLAEYLFLNNFTSAVGLAQTAPFINFFNVGPILV